MKNILLSLFIIFPVFAEQEKDTVLLKHQSIQLAVKSEITTTDIFTLFQLKSAADVIKIKKHLDSIIIKELNSCPLNKVPFDRHSKYELLFNVIRESGWEIIHLSKIFKKLYIRLRKFHGEYSRFIRMTFSKCELLFFLDL